MRVAGMAAPRDELSMDSALSTSRPTTCTPQHHQCTVHSTLSGAIMTWEDVVCMCIFHSLTHLISHTTEGPLHTTCTVKGGLSPHDMHMCRLMHWSNLFFM